MRTYFYLFIFILPIIYVHSACSKTTESTTFSFKSSGADVPVDSTYAYLYTYTTSTESRRQIQILAYSGGKQVLEILALARTGPQPVLSDCFITYYKNGGYNSSDVFISDAGGVNFSTCDTVLNSIKGTFSVESSVNADSMSNVITEGKIFIDKINR